MDQTKAMTLRLSGQAARELETVAQVDEVSVSEVIRIAIDSYIGERRKDKVFKDRVRRTIEQNQEILQRLSS